MLENQQKKKVEIAKIRVKLNVLKDDLEIAVRERDFMKAQDMQMEIDELDENLQVSSFLEEKKRAIVPFPDFGRVMSKTLTKGGLTLEVILTLVPLTIRGGKSLH